MSEKYQLALTILKKELFAEERAYQLFWGSFARRWFLLLNSLHQPKIRKTQLLFAALPRPLYLAALCIAAKLQKQNLDT